MSITINQKRVKIAEICGFKFLKISKYISGDSYQIITPEEYTLELWRSPEYKCNNSVSGIDWQEYPFRSISEICLYGNIPDYFNDLNAMHEAEKFLKSKVKNPDNWSTWFNYTNKLSKLMSQQYRDDKLVNAIHATAAQRAEAFGRTLNLW